MNTRKSYWHCACLVVAALLSVTPMTGSAEADDQGKSRAEIYAEMESTFGIVPTFFKSIPDATLELEWELMKGVQMAPGPIPGKYKELIGIAVAAATKCEYCVYFHTEFARLNGATEEEIQSALHYTKATTGWSTYINGSQVDLDLFRSEVDTIVKHVTEQAAKAEK